MNLRQRRTSPVANNTVLNMNQNIRRPEIRTRNERPRIIYVTTPIYVKNPTYSSTPESPPVATNVQTNQPIVPTYVSQPITTTNENQDNYVLSLCALFVIILILIAVILLK